jgi:hypothetical protein
MNATEGGPPLVGATVTLECEQNFPRKPLRPTSHRYRACHSTVTDVLTTWAYSPREYPERIEDVGVSRAIANAIPLAVQWPGNPPAEPAIVLLSYLLCLYSCKVIAVQAEDIPREIGPSLPDSEVTKKNGDCHFRSPQCQNDHLMGSRCRRYAGSWKHP